jgi:glycosyltransferase involved in cell wall biosynthesis
MRILHLTPGTGNFYCGNCLRDNAVALALRQRGHDAHVIPLYLPFMTDGADADPHMPIFFGGLNCYLEQKVSLFRRWSPAWLDNLLTRPSLLRFVSRFSGMTSARELGEMTVSMLKGEEGRQARELDKLIDWLKDQGKPDVVCLSNGLIVGLARRIRSELNVPVTCALHGEDSFLDSLPEPYRSESWQLMSQRATDVTQFIVVSRYYDQVMRQRLGLAANRTTVIHNGIDLTGYAPAPQPPATPTIGFLARMHHGKGLTILTDAFIDLKKRGTVNGLRLSITGTKTTDDDPYITKLQHKLGAAGVAGDVEWHPNVSHDEKIRLLQSVTVLSTPATYGESFGLYVIEAMAAGVPVVQPRHAAFPELIEMTGGGVLCEPDDARSLAAALEPLLRDPSKARAMGMKGREAVLREFSIERMAEKTEVLLRSITPRA